MTERRKALMCKKEPGSEGLDEIVDLEQAKDIAVEAAQGEVWRTA